MRLTAAAVEKLKAESKRREVPDDLCRGLFLIIQPSGRKSWAARYRHGGKPRKLTLGAFPLISLAVARERAHAALREVAEGRDPAAEKAAPRTNRLSEAVLEDFLTRGCAQHRTQAETRRLLEREVLPHWRGRHIESIERRDVINRLYELTDRGTLVQANRLYGRLRRMFNWCVETGVLESSPMQGLRRPATEHERDRVLADDELRAIYGACAAIGWPFGPLVRLLALTAQRRDEVGGMRWSELDTGKSLWTIPGWRMKNGEEHQVPLAGPALAIVQELPRIGNSDWVFTTNGETPVSGFSRAKTLLDKAAAVTGWTFHDLRRTAATGMARFGIPPHVADAVLGHRQGTIRGVARIYNKFAYIEERRRALEMWAGHVTGLIKPVESNVVLLGMAAS